MTRMTGGHRIPQSIIVSPFSFVKGLFWNHSPKKEGKNMKLKLWIILALAALIVALGANAALLLT